MGVRAGQGYGVAKPKRAHCPECGKKGVKQWYVTPCGIFRDCQYCQHTWGELSWKIATAKRSEGPGAATAVEEPVPAKAFMSAAPTTAYTHSRIAAELDATATGRAYHGNALRVAKDIPGVNDQERALLDRWATGIQDGTDHVALQDLANNIRKIANC